MADIGKIQKREIADEMRESYLDYAMSVIVARALPDVRDGLKPVHRRILYTMNEMGLTRSAKFRKSAAVVGDTLGKFHPHGDMAVYDAMVRMAQSFSLRYPLVNGQGNFGCFTGDTKVHLIDGRDLSFAELIKEAKQGEKHFTYTYNRTAKKVDIAQVLAPRLTEKNAELVKVILDTGEEIRCTPNHRFLLLNGCYREARDLKPNDSLMPVYTRQSSAEDDSNMIGYEMVFQPKRQRWDYAHHLSDEWNIERGTYPRSMGRIRHHLDFNKRNNNPGNIQRMHWTEHWRRHYEFMSHRHKTDQEYREKLARGRAAFLSDGEVRKRIGERMRRWNQKQWKDPAYRAEKRNLIRALWKNRAYREKMAALASARLKEKWGEAQFRETVGKKKSDEMKLRWREPTYRKRQGQIMEKVSQKIWATPGHRTKISARMKTLWQDLTFRANHGAASKANWENPEYRGKFSQDHFVNAARLLGEDPRMKAFHREKLRKQWRDPFFREKCAEAMRRLAAKRRAEDPQYMQRLTEKAKAVLRNKWEDPSYRETVMKNKIAGYVAKLLSAHGAVTQEIYELGRTNNGVPRIENALAYFSDFNEILEHARVRNHKVVQVEFIPEREDVYDLSIDGTHNFALAAGVFVHNSLDNDPPAAQRYTEVRLERIADELLRDINKDTVDFVPSYDATRTEPTVLPAAIPNLLLNGSFGIAVGMATSIPPHNLNEVVDAIAHLIRTPEATNEDLAAIVTGPDFPTGGIIYNQQEIRQAYAVGRGAILMRGVAEIVEKTRSQDSGREGLSPAEGEARSGRQIIITEIPYQVNKAELVEKIAELVRDKKIEGIRDLRDESDKDGLRIAIDLKADAIAQKVLNGLFKYTDLEKNFNLNMLALVDGIQPQVLSLKQMLELYLKHREHVVKRRTRFDLARTKERIHILEGLAQALDHIDAVIDTIKKSEDRERAHVNLKKKFGFSDAQTTAILDMRLATLAGLERQKIDGELKEKLALAKTLETLLKDPKKILAKIDAELSGLKTTYGDERKTKVVKTGVREIAEEDLIAEADIIIVLTRGGYIKRLKPDVYRAQKRGGKGISGIETKEEDVVEHFLTSNTHSDLLFFTSTGKVFHTKAYEIPEGSRISKGKAIFNFLSIRPDERIMSLVAIAPPGRTHQRSETRSIVMVTERGMIKRVHAGEFENVRKSGIVAISLKKDDHLAGVAATSGRDELLLATRRGQAIRFREGDVRTMGRGASGVKAMRLKKDDRIIGLNVIGSGEEKAELLVVFERGFGKKTPIQEYKRQKRGGSGLKTAKVRAKNGPVVSTRIIREEAELVAISQKGQVIRTGLSSIPTLGRATQGVRVMKLDEQDRLASITLL